MIGVPSMSETLPCTGYTFGPESPQPTRASAASQSPTAPRHLLLAIPLRMSRPLLFRSAGFVAGSGGQRPVEQQRYVFADETHRTFGPGRGEAAVRGRAGRVASRPATEFGRRVRAQVGVGNLVPDIGWDRAPSDGPIGVGPFTPLAVGSHVFADHARIAGPVRNLREGEFGAH